MKRGFLHPDGMAGGSKGGDEGGDKGGDKGGDSGTPPRHLPSPNSGGDAEALPFNRIAMAKDNAPRKKDKDGLTCTLCGKKIPEDDIPRTFLVDLKPDHHNTNRILVATVGPGRSSAPTCSSTSLSLSPVLVSLRLTILELLQQTTLSVACDVCC